jgi:D-3-phosphoglycerate dehydrogenase / 2-oxoglutarate reductase
MAKGDTIVYIDCDEEAAVETELLAERGYELVLADCSTDEEVIKAVGNAPGILNGIYYMGPSLFAQLPELKVVVRAGVGYDNIDVAAATEAGVIVCNTVNYGTNEVANHAFAMLLALNRSLLPLDHAVRKGIRGPAPEMMPHTGRMAGQTLGLVGFGAIGQAMARRAAGFDMRVIAFDPYFDSAKNDASNVELVDLPELLAQSDYVSVHAPLTPATRGLIAAPELALMKPSSYLILTSRGGVVDEAALTDSLRDGRIAGAGIDVWEKEPPEPTNPLLAMDNVVGSMHMAWYSEVADVVRREIHAGTAADVLDGVMPHSIVNPEVLDRISASSPKAN